MTVPASPPRSKRRLRAPKWILAAPAWAWFLAMFAAPQREAHPVDRLDHAAAQAEMGVQVAHLEDGLAHSWRTLG